MRRRRTIVLAVAAAGALCMAGLPTAQAADGLAGAIHYASDLDWVSATNGWGPVERDTNNGARAEDDRDRTVQSIRGTKYPKGLGVHAPSRIVYDVAQECTQLLGYVGIDDSQAPKGRVDFAVLVDGAEKFRLERKGTDPAGILDVDLRGARTVELVVEPGPEGNGNDHADWADLRLNCTETALPRPLTITPRAGDLTALAPGTPFTVSINGADPRVPVTVGFAGTSVLVNSDDGGRATASLVVPAGTTAGQYTVTAQAQTRQGTAHAETAARVRTSSGRTFYVDCSRTDKGDGSEAKPFGSLDQLSAVQPFEPGQSIRFKRGARCVGTFAPQGSGLATAPITVAPFGAGDKEATIDGDGALAGIHLLNVDYWTVDGMHVVNPATPDQRRVGILYEINDGAKHSGVVLTRNHVENVAGWSDKTKLGNSFSRSAGISVLTDATGWFEGITITNNAVNDTAAGGIKISAPDSTAHYNTHVYVAHNDIHAVGGDGIVVHNSDAPLVEYNSAIDLGQGKYPFLDGNFAGMWPFNSKDPLFQYNVVGNSVGSKYDSTAWDCDWKITGTCTFQYNYSYGNAGGFYLNCVAGCSGAAMTTTVVLRYNVSQDDCRLAGSSSGTGTHRIYNNTFSCLGRPFADDLTGPREVKNNIFITPGGTLKTANAVYESNAYFGGITPPTSDKRAIVGDPRLIAAGSGQLTRALPGYQLAVGSPLLGAGTPIAGAGGQDFFGNPIPATPNIGAYQGAGVTPGPLPFRELVNQTAVASSVNPRNGSITKDYRVLSAEALATAGLKVAAPAKVFGTEIDWHPTAVGTPDAIKAAGQQVALHGEGDALIVVGFSVGAAGVGTATVHYQDGTTQQIAFNLPQWNDPPTTTADTVTVAKAATHLQRTNPYLGGKITQVDAPASVFAQRIPLSGKPVASITLPQGNPVTGTGGPTVLALSLARSGA